ncbi:MAG: hypothetical protein AAFQ68_27650, partial [Bacteroidota bacterium]
ARLSNQYADTLILNWPDFVEVSTLALNGEALTQVKDDPEQSLVFYVIPEAMRADSSLQMTLKAQKQYVGFTQSDVQADLTYEGSLGSIKDFLPTIGYDGDVALEKNRLREAHGLAKLVSRKAEVNDPAALQKNLYAPDAKMVTGMIEISVPGGQIPFAPGKLVSKESGERNLYRFRIDEPAIFDWYLGAASYAVAEAKSDETAYSILHQPQHTFNLELYHDAMQKGIKYMDERLGLGDIDEIRLVEVHRWQEDAYVFPNTIAISEKEGWVADTEGLKEKAYIYQTIGSGIAKLWVQQHLDIADVQGADMLAVALPEALGLYFVEHVLGSEAVEQIIEKKMDAYAKDRNNEPNQEPSLLYADGTEYLETNKGAVTLYKVIEQVGLNAFVNILVEQSQSPVTFRLVYDRVREQLPRELELEISSI